MVLINSTADVRGDHTMIAAILPFAVFCSIGINLCALGFLSGVRESREKGKRKLRDKGERKEREKRERKERESREKLERKERESREKVVRFC
jgi:hypothetical protein